MSASRIDETKAFVPIRLAVLTVSDTRTRENDTSGDTLVERLTSAGHVLADRALLRDTGAHIAHSPSSNLFLGSGLFDWQAAIDSGHRVSIASDVGGGTSLSLLRTLPQREFQSGAYELLKCGLIGDRALFGRVVSLIA